MIAVTKVVCPNSESVEGEHVIRMLEGESKNGAFLYDCENCSVGAFTAAESAGFTQFAEELGESLGLNISIAGPVGT